MFSSCIAHIQKSKLYSHKSHNLQTLYHFTVSLTTKKEKCSKSNLVFNVRQIQCFSVWQKSFQIVATLSEPELHFSLFFLFLSFSLLHFPSSVSLSLPVNLCMCAGGLYFSPCHWCCVHCALCFAVNCFRKSSGPRFLALPPACVSVVSNWLS